MGNEIEEHLELLENMTNQLISDRFIIPEYAELGQEIIELIKQYRQEKKADVLNILNDEFICLKTFVDYAAANRAKMNEEKMDNASITENNVQQEPEQKQQIPAETIVLQQRIDDKISELKAGLNNAKETKTDNNIILSEENKGPSAKEKWVLIDYNAPNAEKRLDTLIDDISETGSKYALTKTQKVVEIDEKELKTIESSKEMINQKKVMNDSDMEGRYTSLKKFLESNYGWIDTKQGVKKVAEKLKKASEMFIEVAKQGHFSQDEYFLKKGQLLAEIDDFYDGFSIVRETDRADFCDDFIFKE